MYLMLFWTQSSILIRWKMVAWSIDIQLQTSSKWRHSLCCYSPSIVSASTAPKVSIFLLSSLVSKGQDLAAAITQLAPFPLSHLTRHQTSRNGRSVYDHHGSDKHFGNEICYFMMCYPENSYLRLFARHTHKKDRNTHFNMEVGK